MSSSSLFAPPSPLPTGTIPPVPAPGFAPHSGPPQLRGRVTSISWRDPRSGETLARIAPAGPNPRNMSYSFWGTFAHEFVAEETVVLSGGWHDHPSLGRVYKVTDIERQPPTTREGEATFLRGYIKGLTKKQAGALLDHFGGLQQLAEACKKRPQDLVEVLPNARKTVARLRGASWDRREIDIDLFTSLQAAGLRHSQVNELVRFFGASALRQIVRATPYDTCQVPRIGFASAEKIAQFCAEALGRKLDKFNEERLVYGLCDVVARERNNGHVCVPEARILRAAIRHLELPSTQESLSRLQAALTSALTRRLLIKEFDTIYTRGLARAEGQLAAHLGKLLLAGARPLPQSPRAILRALESTRLSEEQKQAVVTMGTHAVSILVGGPGRGKTATLASLVDLLDKAKRSYMLLAPTGKAAKRAQESTGKPCLTIHKACGLDREEDVHAKKFGRHLGRRDRFPVDVVIIDETSMVDLALGFEVVRRCKPGKTALVFVGDPDQLPPVSAGQVLKDLLASEVVPVARLTQVFRQASGSPIVDGADRLNTGEIPEFSPNGYEARLFDPLTAKSHPGLTASESDRHNFEIQITSAWLTQALRRYAADLSIDPVRDIQVYAPQKSGPLGLEALNMTLQRMLNPATLTNNQGQLKIGDGFAVRVGDKVMQTSNNYRLRLANAPAAVLELGRVKRKKTDLPVDTSANVTVMNGQVGFVTAVNPQRGEVQVRYPDFDEPVVYARSDEWRQLAPAYAMSIHRSQGSETPYAFIVLHDSMNPRLVNRPLIYTAWTRAKKGAALFATRASVERAAKNLDGTVRHTNLHRRLQQIAGAAQVRPKLKLPTVTPAVSPTETTPVGQTVPLAAPATSPTTAPR